MNARPTLQLEPMDPHQPDRRRAAYAPRTRPQHPTWTLLRLACAWTIMLACIVAADYFIN